MLKWQTVKKRVNDLIPYEKNPRKITEKQMDDLKRLIEEMGLVEIPAVDFDGMIIAGHQRIKALQLLGRGDEEIDVRIPNRKLTQQEFEKYNVGSNKLGGEWDWDKLATLDIEILKQVGFEQDELDMFLGTGFSEDLEEIDMQGDLGEEEKGEYIIIAFENFNEIAAFKKRFGLKEQQRTVKYSKFKEFLK